MGQSRHPLPAVLALGLVLVAAASGCGSSGGGSTSGRHGGTGGSADGAPRTSTAPAGASAQGCPGAVRGVGGLRVVGVGCAIGRGLVAAWSNRPPCANAPAGRSHTACTVGGYRCIGAVTDRGLAVSCAAPGRTISFAATRG